MVYAFEVRPDDSRKALCFGIEIYYGVGSKSAKFGLVFLP